MNRKRKNSPKNSKEACYQLLRMYGVPKTMVDSILADLILYSVTEGKDLKYDRIYSGVALMLWRRYKLSGPEILEGLREFDRICGSVLDKDENGKDIANWTELMEELRDETGIVIHTGDDNRLICECEWEEEEIQEVEE